LDLRFVIAVHDELLPWLCAKSAHHEGQRARGRGKLLAPGQEVGKCQENSCVLNHLQGYVPMTKIFCKALPLLCSTIS
jgi:hypothetical protein